MITMFVRDQDPVQAFGAHSNRFKPSRDLASTETGVHQKPALICRD